MRRAFNDLAKSYHSDNRSYPRRPLILIAARRQTAMAIAAAFEAVREHCLLTSSLKDGLGKLNLAPAACLVDVTDWNAGWTFIERIRAGETQSQLPIFLISQKELTSEQKKRIKTRAVQEWIVKPFNTTTMRRKVMDAILRDALKRGKSLDSMAC